MLEYSPANTKLKQLYDVPELQTWLKQNPTLSTYGKKGRKVYSLDLLSGWSCPSAKDCLSKVIELPTGKKAIKDGPETEFRCFSASQEVVYPGVYRRRKHNYDTLRNLSIGGMIHELNYSLPKDAGILRYHVGGDFFNSKYFFAAITIALMNPDKLFYAYTKSLKYWIKYRQWADAAENLILTASRGGRDDSLIDSEGLRESVVVFSEAEAKEKGLEIDHDDSHAAVPDWEYDNFALLVHGVQPAGSEAGKAVRALKGKGSYGRKAKV